MFLEIDGLTLHQPDVAIAAAIGGATCVQVAFYRRDFPRRREAGYVDR